jgi:hypothetical protein
MKKLGRCTAGSTEERCHCTANRHGGCDHEDWDRFHGRSFHTMRLRSSSSQRACGRLLPVGTDARNRSPPCRQAHRRSLRRRSVRSCGAGRRKRLGGLTEEYSIGRRRDEAQDVGSVAAELPESIAQGRRGDCRHLLISIADHASLPRIVALPRLRCRLGASTQQALQAMCDMGIVMTKILPSNRIWR